MTSVMNKAITTLGSSAMLGLLVACGGGGGGAATAGSLMTPEAPASSPVGSEEDTSTALTSTGDLVVPDDFNISEATSWQLDVDLELDLYDNGGQAFVAVCSEYLGDSPNFRVAYDDCLVRETTMLDSFQKSVAVSTSIDTLLLAVWFPNSSDPTRSRVLMEYSDLGGDNTTISYTQ